MHPTPSPSSSPLKDFLRTYDLSSCHILNLLSNFEVSLIFPDFLQQFSSILFLLFFYSHYLKIWHWSDIAYFLKDYINLLWLQLHIQDRINWGIYFLFKCIILHFALRNGLLSMVFWIRHLNFTAHCKLTINMPNAQKLSGLSNV